MVLSNSLLKKFARITNDVSSKTDPGTNVYATAVVIEEKIGSEESDAESAVAEDPERGEIEGAETGDTPSEITKVTKYVRLDGSDILTPVSEAADIRDGDRVLVTISNHTATVVGNITAPPSARTATDLDPLIDAQIARIDTLIAGQITTGYLDANYAKIGRLEAQEAKIKKLEADQITTGYLDANYAKISRLEAQEAKISILEANQVTTEYLNTNYAEIGLANVSQASVGKLFADIGLVSDMTISNGQITGELQGVTISANQLTAGRIDAADIEVVNLNASNLTVGTINGQIIRPGTITAEALTKELNDLLSEKTDVQEALDKIEENKAAAEKMIDGIRSDLGDVGKISIHGGNISSNSITAEKIAANAITSDKIAANAITAGKLSVATLSSITADVGTLTAGIIQSANYAKLAGVVFPNFCRTGMLINVNTGLIQSPNFVVDSSGAYIDGTVYATAGSISGSIVTSGISASNITTGTLSADRIAAGSINGNKLVAASVTATQMAASTITAAEIASNAITSAKIASNAVTAVKIASGAITTEKLAAGSVTAVKIAAGAITADKIAANSITGDKLSVSSLSSITANIGSISTGDFGGFFIYDNYIESKPNGNPNAPYGQIRLCSAINDEPRIEVKNTTNGSTLFSVDANGYISTPRIRAIVIENKEHNNEVMYFDQGTYCHGITIENIEEILLRYGKYVTISSSSNSEVGFRIKNGKVSENVRFIISSAGNKGIYDGNGDVWILMCGTDNIIKMPRVYTNTVTSSANVNVASNGSIRRYASSSQRYKHNIRYYSNEENAVSSLQKRSARGDDDGLLSILKLPVCSFLYNDGYITEEGYDPERPIYGFIAEDVDYIAPDATDYRMEGYRYIPESWDVKKLFPKVVYVAQKHESEIQQCKEAITLMYGILEQAGLLTSDIKDRVLYVMDAH